MIQILEVKADGTALVSTLGLLRVVIQPSGEIADELVTRPEADAFVDGFNACNSKRRRWAEAVDYTASRGNLSLS